MQCSKYLNKTAIKENYFAFFGHKQLRQKRQPPAAEREAEIVKGINTRPGGVIDQHHLLLLRHLLNKLPTLVVIYLF